MSNSNGRDFETVSQQMRLAEALYRGATIADGADTTDVTSSLSSYELNVASLLAEFNRVWGVLAPDGEMLVFGAAGHDVIVTSAQMEASATYHIGMVANENLRLSDAPKPHDLTGDDWHQGEKINPINVIRNFDADEWTNSQSTGMFIFGVIPVQCTGSDVMQGRSGSEMFDGDAWLRVRIDIVTRLPGEEGIPFEDIPNDEAHFVKTISSLAEVQADLLAGLIDPGQLRIVRDVVSTVATPSADVVAVEDAPGRLTIEGSVQRAALPEAKGEGVINVQNAPAAPVPLRPANDDGSDLLLNLERVHFISEGPNSARDSSGAFTYSGGRPGYSRLNSALPFILAVGTLVDPEAYDLSISFFWEMLGAMRSDEAQLAEGHEQSSANSDETARVQVLGSTTDAQMVAVESAPSEVEGDQVNVAMGMEAVEGDTLLTLAAADIDSADMAARAASSLAAQAVAGSDAGFGAGGLALVLGTSGNDAISMADALSGVEIHGGAGDDVLVGSMWNDAIFGGSGNDVIDGLAGNDLMVGGTGSDTYFIDSTDDAIVEDAGSAAGDRDIAYVSADGYVLADNVEVAVVAEQRGLQLTGNSGDNVLIGGAGADKIAGGRGNDVLLGGAGADQLDGGAGDDTIVYDAADDLPNVRGGSGTDTLAVTGDAPVDFDLVGQGFERAVVKQTDDANTENWSTIIETFVDNWQLAAEEGEFDNGGTWRKEIDISGQELHEYVVDYLNAAGQLTETLTQNRDGTSVDTYFDVDDVQDFVFYIEYRDAEQRQTGRFVRNDDLTSNDTNFDAANEFDWSAISNTSDNSGRITTAKTVFDDDSMVVIRYDASNDNDAQDWRSVTEYVNGDGDMTREMTSYDNGNVRDVYFDVADAEAWNFEAYIYDPEGNEIDHFFG